MNLNFRKVLFSTSNHSRLHHHRSVYKKLNAKVFGQGWNCLDCFLSGQLNRTSLCENGQFKYKMDEHIDGFTVQTSDIPCL
jgi:hypothetical protein